MGSLSWGGACELNYGRFVVSQCGNSPSVTINTADVRLHSGVGVGTDRTDVMRIFGANPYDPTIGLYHLVFSYIGNSVSAISIVYTGNVASSPVAATTQPAVSPVTISSRAIVMPNSSEIENSPQGVYWCYEPSWSSGSIRLLPDGDYQVNDVTVGRYTVQHNRIIFTGYLKDRNNGIAQIYNNSFVFKWTDKQGEAQYFAYRKNR